ncbi:MAG: hypothetical protein ACRYFS_03050 [Janthinobacterium lividum]
MRNALSGLFIYSASVLCLFAALPVAWGAAPALSTFSKPAVGNTAPVQHSAQSATITVNAAKTLGLVNPLAFGDNLEAADPTHIYPGASVAISIHTADGAWDDQNKRPDPFVVSTMRSLRLGTFRYPGGTLANNYDWHKAVGPLSTRGDWHFGIDEYIETCRTMGCQPQFIVSDYVGTPKDAADLVQYLNSPATPNHPWAMLRAKCGHVQPYHVHLFELGNETDNGGGYPWRIMSAEQYAEYADATIKAMKRVDPTVKIGIISATGKLVQDPWNSIVLKKAGAGADFLVLHLYAVGYDSFSPVDRFMRGCMASPDQYRERFAEYHALTRHILGHDLPIALTEYNGAFGEGEPPLRFSYGSALFSADLIRELLQPSNGILLANYWQAVNGYWGFLRGDGDSWTEMPAYYTRRLWGQHFGNTLLATAVNSPKADFEGVQLADPAHGTHFTPSRPVIDNLLPVPILSKQAANHGFSVNAAGLVTYSVKHLTENQYPIFAALPTPKAGRLTGCIYKISADVQTIASSGSGDAHISLGVADSRGWSSTLSAIQTNGGPADGHWRHVSGLYTGLTNAASADVLLRIENPTAPFEGTVRIKNLVLSAETRKTFPAYDIITSSASMSRDGKTLYLIVFNKSTTNDVLTTIQLGSFAASSAKRWTVTGPDLACTTTGTGGVSETESGVSTPLSSSHSLTRVFLARSMTALELQVAGSHQ